MSIDYISNCLSLTQSFYPSTRKNIHNDKEKKPDLETF